MRLTTLAILAAMTLPAIAAGVEPSPLPETFKPGDFKLTMVAIVGETPVMFIDFPHDQFATKQACDEYAEAGDPALVVFARTMGSVVAEHVPAGVPFKVGGVCLPTKDEVPGEDT